MRKRGDGYAAQPGSFAGAGAYERPGDGVA